MPLIKGFFFSFKFYYKNVRISFSEKNKHIKPLNQVKSDAKIPHQSLPWSLEAKIRKKDQSFPEADKNENVTEYDFASAITARVLFQVEEM